MLHDKYTLKIAVSLLFLLGFKAHVNGQRKPAVNVADIRPDLAVLANDSMAGRKPFTAGEAKTIGYISSRFRSLGLEPGNKGSYFQEVPMMEITSTPDSSTIIDDQRQQNPLKFLTDFVASTRKNASHVKLKNSPLVFVGYGIVAPEYHWDDYKDVDVKGKTVVVLINDPGFKSGGEKLFKGDTMTYYGRWTYKYEEAARRGAAGVLIIHQSQAAGYGWNVITSSFSGGRLYLRHPASDQRPCNVEGWLSESAATSLLKGAGIHGDIRAFARTKQFKAVDLKKTISLSLQNKVSYSISRNVIAVLKGKSLPDESIIYSAHWDHLGIGKPDSGKDSIYNGAIDNASGVAAMLGIARAFTRSDNRPGRSIVFIAFTAEEQGLLGSQYYVDHPVFPLAKTVADLNMDVMLDYGQTKDIVDIPGMLTT